MSRDIERQAAAGLKWSSVAKLTGQAVSWAVTIVVFRLLSPGDYGLMALSMVLISIVAGVAEFGLGSSLVQMPRLDTGELARVAGALATLNIGCGLIIVFGAPLFAKLLGNPALTPIIQVLSVQFLLTAIECIPQSLAYRRMDFRRLAGIELASTLLGALTTLTLAWIGAGVWALVAGTLSAGALRTLLYVALGGFVWPSFDLRGIGHHIRFGGAVTASRLLWQATSQADILIAGRMFSQQIVGLYSVSMHLASLPMTKVMGIINHVAFPAVARMQGEVERLKHRLLNALRLLALAALPIMWGISAVAHEFVDILLGEQWHPSIPALRLVAFVTPFRMLAAVLSTALTAVGRADLDLRNTIVGAIVMPLAFIIGAHYCGLNGLAVSWVIAVPIVFLLTFPYTLPALAFSTRELGAAVRAPLIAGLVMYLAVTMARIPLQDLEEAVRLAPLVIVGAAAYGLTIWLLDRTIWTDVQKLAAGLRG
jgi:O-antigen/teichoic acid export membrane protein